MNRPNLVSAISLTFLLAVLLISGCTESDTEIRSQELVNPSWERQFDDSTSFFVGLHAVDENTVWAAGGNGQVVHTSDGGDTWKSDFVEGMEGKQFRDVHAFDDNRAFVLAIGPGADSRIFRTSDGGDTWDLSFQNENENGFFDCFSFWDDQRGFAFSDSHEGEFTLIHTQDGGDSWTRIDPELVPDARPREGAFAASGTCAHTYDGGLGWFATGASGVDTRVIRTTDYGATWSEAVTPIASLTSTEGISTMSVLDAEHLAVLGGDFAHTDSIYANVATSNDGGKTWHLAGNAILGGSVYGSSYVPGAFSPTIVGVAPTGSTFSADNGMTWALIDTTDFWTVSIVSVDAGWAAGPGGVSRLVNNATH